MYGAKTNNTAQKPARNCRLHSQKVEILTTKQWRKYLST